MRIVASIIVASMMGTAAWASDLTIQTVGELYVGQPVGFEVTGLAQGEKMRLLILQDDGDLVTMGKAMGDATGTAFVYGMLTNNAESVEVQVQSLAGSEGVETFTIVAVPDGSTGYDDGYDAGYAACEAGIPDGEYYCDTDSTDWDEVAGACVSSVEEPMNCFQSAFCQTSNDNYYTGLPNSIVGNATQAECQADYNSTDYWAWDNGSVAADQLYGYGLWVCGAACGNSSICE